MKKRQTIRCNEVVPVSHVFVHMFARVSFAALCGFATPFCCFVVYAKLYCGIRQVEQGVCMNNVTILSPQASLWGTIISIANLLVVLAYLWLGFVLLLGSWKLFRFLIKWKP